MIENRTGWKENDNDEEEMEIERERERCTLDNREGP